MRVQEGSVESRYVLRQVFEERLREVLAVEGEPSQEAMAAAARRDGLEGTPDPATLKPKW